jgi:phosphoglycerate dehydrogenase-like enzyme
LESFYRMSKVKFVAASLIRPMIEAHLPDWVEPHWFMTKDEALALAPLAEIGWFDMYDKQDMAAIITAATNLKWLNSIYAGVDGMPLSALKKRGTKVTNGAGINAITIAEYVVMGMLTIAKGYRDVVRAQERHEWLIDSPGKVELYGSKALLLGYGAIGKLIDERLKAFNVDVTVVRRTPGPDSLAPDAWRARLGEFDWVILAVPATAETEEMIGADELAAMKQSAVMVNIARGSVIDQDALVKALQAGRLHGVGLDVLEVEPSDATNPLYAFPNVVVSPHNAASTEEGLARMARQAARNILDVLDGRRDPAFMVNHEIA